MAKSAELFYNVIQWYTLYTKTRYLYYHMYDILMQKKWEFVQCIFGYNPNLHKILFWSNMNYVNRVIKPGGVSI